MSQYFRFQILVKIPSIINPNIEHYFLYCKSHESFALQEALVEYIIIVSFIYMWNEHFFSHIWLSCEFPLPLPLKGNHIKELKRRKLNQANNGCLLQYYSQLN